VKTKVMLAVVSSLSLSFLAQANVQATAAVETEGQAPVYRVIVISRTVQAVNYRHRSGATDVDLAGTPLLPSADGKVKVRSKRGTMEVEAEFGNLQRPGAFGNEYLTYVMWAISPEGRASPVMLLFSRMWLARTPRGPVRQSMPSMNSWSGEATFPLATNSTPWF